MDTLIDLINHNGMLVVFKVTLPSLAGMCSVVLTVCRATYRQQLAPFVLRDIISKKEVSMHSTSKSVTIL